MKEPQEAQKAQIMCGLCFLWFLFFFQVPGPKKSVWEGAYTTEQADLGGKGEVPALKGDNFMERWHDYSVKPLFEMIRTEMPPLRFRTPETKPLPDNVYVDIISYIFKSNGFPAGDSELSLTSLDQVQILSKTGVQPPPQFAL